MLKEKNIQRNVKIRIISWILVAIIGVIGFCLFGIANLYATNPGADTPAILMGVPIGALLMFFSFMVFIVENVLNRIPRPERPYSLIIQYLIAGFILLAVFSAIIFIVAMSIGGHLSYLYL